MKHFLCILSCLYVFAAISVAAETPADSLGILSRIAENERISVSQPEKLAARLMPNRSGKSADADAGTAVASPTGGFRIQVFSGNNPRTARAEAHSRAAAIGAEFPEWVTYINYDAPYWRLKVGDFRSYEDGRAALSLLKKHFPAYAKEMRLVRDRIKTSANGN